jgi:dihydropteroate synthase
MGILNVTPDSFSDGGRYVEPGAAVERAIEMAAEGADVIDIGGESTRPGSNPVAPEEQSRRIVPVIREARARGLAVPISVDTRFAVVAAAALDAGADMVNDISGVRDDPAMPALLARRRVPFVVMHMQGTPQTMQQTPKYKDVVAEVAAFFVSRAEALAAAGVDVNRMIVDPGLGFGKTLEHNLALLRSIRFFGVRWPVVVGPSRKRFLGEILNEPEPAKRIMGTAAVVAHCALAGMDMVRVHDVKEMWQVAEVCARLRSGAPSL